MAFSAEDALEKCRFNFYDIILCDFNLGQGKNGQQVLEALRVSKRLKHTHMFIMVTAETAKDVVLGAREYQPDAYIAKPITRTVLEQRLGQLVLQQKILKPINKEIDLNNPTKAISLCIQLLEDKTKYQSWCYQTLAQLYLEVGDTENAISTYKTINSKRELPWAVLGLGIAYLKATKYEDAIKQLNRAIELNPNMVEAYDALSQCYLNLGSPKKAQEQLSIAVDISPRMVTRHEKLGDLCQQNQDIDAAVKSYSRAIKYGEHSIHDSPTNYLNLGRCLCDKSESNQSDEGKAYALEAVDILDTMTRKFPSEEDACLNATLIEVRVHKGQSLNDKANEKLHQAECMIEEENLSADVCLEFAKTLYTMEQDKRADSLLVKLADQFSEDPNILAKIESLMDEPESLTARKQAKALNKTGIGKFDHGDLVGAIEDFKAALEHTPKHAALNLNLVQVITKHFRSNPDKDLITSAQEALDRISHIPEQHNQFKRLKHLEQQLNQLINNSNNTV